MLSKAALKKATASIVVFVFTFLSLTLPSEEIKQIRIQDTRYGIIYIPESIRNLLLNELIKDSLAHAGDFENTVTSGQSAGADLLNSYSPQNIDQTLQNKGLGTANTITPQASEAETQRGSYEGHYTDPGGMASADINTSDAGSFVNESYEHRQKFDLSADPTFGNKCLEKDADGKCIRYSASSDVVTNTYADCQKIVTPQYGDPPTEQTCTGTNTEQTTQCRINTNVGIETETINTPCSSTSPEYKEGQIYAVCKDHYQLYKKFYGTIRERCDNSCSYVESCCGRVTFCIDPPDFILGDPPSDATYLGRGYYNFRDKGYHSGCDDYTSDQYDWYTKYENSVIERIYLRQDSPCGSNVDKWKEECSVSRLEQCDPYGNNCVAVIEDGQATGQTSSDLCQSSSGSIENYQICLNNVTVDNGSGAVQLSDVQSRTDSSAAEYGSNVTEFRIYGGPSVKPYLDTPYVWVTKMTFSCDQVSDNCQPLVDQGCVHYSQRCLNDDCTQVEHTYRCGGTGGVISYDVSYNCGGNTIRCMGSDCKDTSYEANQDFSAVSTAGQILTMARTDGTETEIFPGKDSVCQSNPINCCKPNTSGISIADYVKSMYDGYKLYAILSTGVSASSAALASSIASAVNTIASATGIASTVVTTSAGGTVVTTVTTTIAGTTATSVTTVTGGTGIGTVSTTLSGTSVTASSTTTAVATAVTVVGLVIAAAALCYMIYMIAYSCDKDDMMTSVKLGFNLCHLVGKKCTVRALGLCLQKKKIYCCFNSILARIIHEQGRPQIGIGWGDVDNPNCRGLAPGEINAIDFSRIDLTEYMQYIENKTNVSPDKQQEIIDKVKQKYQP